MSKTCRVCMIELPIERFYKKSGDKYSGICMTCTKARKADPNRKKLTGPVARLGESKFLEIMDEVKNRDSKVPLSSIAKKHDIPVSTFSAWVKKGVFDVEVGTTTVVFDNKPDATSDSDESGSD